MKIFNLRFFVGLLSGLTISGSLSSAPAQAYSFSAVPQFTAVQVYKEWRPLLDRLKKETGIELKIRTYDSIPEFEAAFLRGEVDFAYANPYHAVMGNRAQGYVPLLRNDKPLNGILLVRKDGAKSISELDGKELGFPAPNSFGAALYMRALLIEKESLTFTPNYLKTHPNVFRHVIAGDVAAGGSVRAAFNSEPPAVRERLRVLYETPYAAPHPLMVHPRVSQSVQEKVVETLLRFKKVLGGEALLKAVRMPEIGRADYDLEYLPLEELNLDKYVVKSK